MSFFRPGLLREGIWRRRFVYQPHEGKLYSELSQPSRPIILERNARLQAERGALRDLSFGRLELTIPYEDWLALREKYPDLASKDGEIKTRAWLAFRNSAESRPYRVR